MLRHIRANEARFSSAGREDVDVRMLGTGRPFIVELVNPRTRQLSKELLERIQVKSDLCHHVIYAIIYWPAFLVTMHRS